MTTADTPITEAEISTLVDTFYAKVQHDPVIGPIFNQHVQSWPAHLALLKDFWSSVLLTSGRYKGQPMLAHLNLPIAGPHFQRWLTLFEETAREVMPAAHVDRILSKAHHIAQNFRANIALYGNPTAPSPDE